MEGQALGRVDARRVAAMVRLRVDVFVVEQDCPYPDLDGKDLRAWHVGRREPVAKGAAAVACARSWRRELRRAQHWQGRHEKGPPRKGIGKELMQRSIAVAEQTWPGQDIRISAQCYLEGWYRNWDLRSGFALPRSDIPHPDGQVKRCLTSFRSRRWGLVDLVFDRGFDERHEQGVGIQHR